MAQEELTWGERISQEFARLEQTRPELVLTMGATALSLLETPHFAESEFIIATHPDDTDRYGEYAHYGKLFATQDSSHYKEPIGMVDLDRSGLLPFRSNSVDQVVFNNEFGAHLCHYTHGSRRMLTEAWRIVKPGGYLVSIAHLSSVRSIRETLSDLIGDFRKIGPVGDGTILTERYEETRDLYPKAMELYGLQAHPDDASVTDPYVFFLSKAA